MDPWSLVHILVLQTTILSQPPEPAVRIEVDTISTFDGKDECLNSDLARLAKLYQNKNQIYVCTPGKMTFHPEILSNLGSTDETGFSVFLREDWPE